MGHKLASLPFGVRNLSRNRQTLSATRYARWDKADLCSPPGGDGKSPTTTCTPCWHARKRTSTTTARPTTSFEETRDATPHGAEDSV